MSAGVALVTGGARRIGKAVAEELHRSGFDTVVHYRRSRREAGAVVARLNEERPGSALAVGADLSRPEEVQRLASRALAFRGRLDVLVNNASLYQCTPLAEIGARDWDAFVAVHLQAPLALACQTASALRLARGCIVNLLDLYAYKPLPEHALYCVTKAGMAMLTRCLAAELAPEVRVNAVAPGAILWPEGDADRQRQQEILAGIPLRRTGEPRDVAAAVRYLIEEARYTTGEVLYLDGGRRLRT